jgi:GntR family transcriptional regulator
LDIPGRIDRSSPIPYYYQLQEILRSWIQNDQLPPHTRLPSEADLGDRFDVSRTVVRQALRGLERDGLIYRVKGSGSFVAQPKLRQQISELTSFTEDMRARSVEAGSKVLRQEMVQATELVSGRLDLSRSAPVFLLQRVRYADGEPLAIETAYLGFDGCEVLVRENFEDRSLYKTLAKTCGMRPYQAEQELEAAIVRPGEAEWLEIELGAPVMLIHRTTYDAEMKPVEFVKSVYRGDKYSFVAKLRARPTEGDEEA